MIGVLDTSRSPPTTKFFGRVVMVLPFNIRLPLTDKLSGRVVRCLQLVNFKSPTTDKFSGNFSIAESDKKIDLLNFEFSGNSLSSYSHLHVWSLQPLNPAVTRLI